MIARWNGTRWKPRAHSAAIAARGNIISPSTHGKINTAVIYSVQEMAGSAGYISDKTMRIALQFQDETERLNRDASFEIAQELFNVRRKMKKLEFYVSQLPPKQAEVIRKHYFEEYSWPALQKELHVSSRTLINRRDEGLNELATMYQYMEQVTQSSKKTPEQNG